MRLLFIFFFLSFLFLTDCSEINERLNVINCEYSMDKVEFVELHTPNLFTQADSLDNYSLYGGKFDVSILIDNPNNSAITIDRLDFDFLIDDKQVFQGIVEQQFQLDLQSQDILHIIFDFDGMQLGSAITNVIGDVANKNDMTYKLNGTIYLDTTVGTLSFPINVVKGTVATKTLWSNLLAFSFLFQDLEFDIGSLILPGTSADNPFGKADLTMKLAMYNPNGIELIQENIEGDLLLNDNKVLSSNSIAGNDILNPHSTGEHLIEFSIDGLELGIAAVDLVNSIANGEEMNLELIGNSFLHNNENTQQDTSFALDLEGTLNALGIK